MMRDKVHRYFNRQTAGDLVVLWFGVWIAWWFRRWMGHRFTSFPNPDSSASLAYYNLAMRTLVRSALQSFIIAALALAAWRLFRRRSPKSANRPS